MRLRFPASALITVFALVTADAALARVQVLSSTPAADANVSSVRELKLAFSEPITDKLSGVDIVMTAMRGMTNHQPMKILGFKTALTSDGKTMNVTLPRALPAGTYQVTWHAVSRDGHSTEGNYSFAAR
jgi:methionine-rich copper-binding protein CopC